MTIKTVCVALGILTSLCSTSSAMAVQESRLAGQAMHCAAIFSVLSQAFANDPGKGPKFSKGLEVLTEVYMKEQPSHTGAAALADAVQRRSEAVQELYAAWPSQGATLREDGVMCGAWVEGFLGQGDRYQFIPVYPKVVAPHVRGHYQTLLEEAMRR